MEEDLSELEDNLQSMSESMIQNRERLKRLEQKVDENIFERVAENKARVESLEDKHNQEISETKDEVKWVRTRVLLGMGGVMGLSAITTIVTVLQFVY